MCILVKKGGHQRRQEFAYIIEIFILISQAFFATFDEGISGF